MNRVGFGVDRLIAEGLPSHFKRIGLVTNRSATTSLTSPWPLQPTYRALQRAGIELSALFSPEHGLDGSVDAGERVKSRRKSGVGVPVFSLYGDRRSPDPAVLDTLDLLLFDLPDIGTRFYTYIWTLSHVMEACATARVPLWILDRPNPLSGEMGLIEGPLLDESQISSFVGRWSMPIRHSLTVGELARLWREERIPDLDLQVIPIRGWIRSMTWPQTGNPFVPTSPALTDYETALLYPGTCLFEGSNISEGRGTSTPFKQVGAPWIDGDILSERMNRSAISGAMFRSVRFRPQSGKYRGELCGGLMIHVTDEHRFRPVATALHLLSEIIALYANEFSWSPEPGTSGEMTGLHFDRLIGGTEIRRALTRSGKAFRSQIAHWTRAGDWVERVESAQIYPTHA